MSNEFLYADSLLGKHADYPKNYAPYILCGIERQQGREHLAQSLNLSDITKLPVFFGEDIWQAYEVSWLTPQGKPCVACAEIRIPANSVCMIESKSLKLYLNSLNQHIFSDEQLFVETVTQDLSVVAKAHVIVKLFDVTEGVNNKYTLQGVLLDKLDVGICDYQVNAQSLVCISDQVLEETLYSHLLRSRCPVTGQPDWGSVIISYKGQAIDHQGLLKYIVSFRENQEFHEQCIERMFVDISLRCQPMSLTLSGIYLRRGGLDINPMRSSQNNTHFYLPEIRRQ